MRLMLVARDWSAPATAWSVRAAGVMSLGKLPDGGGLAPDVHQCASLRRSRRLRMGSAAGSCQGQRDGAAHL
jgi:hypothetical protein